MTEAESTLALIANLYARNRELENEVSALNNFTTMLQTELVELKTPTVEDVAPKATTKAKSKNA